MKTKTKTLICKRATKGKTETGHYYFTKGKEYQCVLSRGVWVVFDNKRQMIRFPDTSIVFNEIEKP